MGGGQQPVLAGVFNDFIRLDRASIRLLRQDTLAYLFFGAFGCSEAYLDDVRELIEREYGPLDSLGVSQVFDSPMPRAIGRRWGRG